MADHFPRCAKLLVLLAVAGCAFTTSPSATLGIRGSYRLQTIDGVAMPTASDGRIIDSAYFQVRDDDEIYFVDYYEIPVSGGTPVRGTRTARYRLEETEGGSIGTIPLAPFDDVSAMLFSRDGDAVMVDFYPVMPSDVTHYRVRRYAR